MSKPPVGAPPPAAAVISTNPDPFIRLRESWRVVVDACKGKGQKLKIDALLRSGKLTAIEGDFIVVAFPNQFFIDKMKEEVENVGTRVALEEAFAKVLGKRHQIKCIITPKDGATSGGHLLKAAMEEAGAKIVGGGPQP